MKAIDNTKPHEFVCKAERKLPPDERTVFMVKYIDPYTDAKLQDQIYNVSGVGSNRKERLLSGTQAFEITKKFLCGWKNFLDENDDEVIFDEKSPEANIERLHPQVRRELAEHIRGDSDLEEGESAS